LTNEMSRVPPTARRHSYPVAEAVAGAGRRAAAAPGRAIRRVHAVRATKAWEVVAEAPPRPLEVQIHAVEPLITEPGLAHVSEERHPFEDYVESLEKHSGPTAASKIPVHTPGTMRKIKARSTSVPNAALGSASVAEGPHPFEEYVESLEPLAEEPHPFAAYVEGLDAPAGGASKPSAPMACVAPAPVEVGDDDHPFAAYVESLQSAVESLQSAQAVPSTTTGGESQHPFSAYVEGLDGQASSRIPISVHTPGTLRKIRARNAAPGEQSSHPFASYVETLDAPTSAQAEAAKTKKGFGGASPRGSPRPNRTSGAQRMRSRGNMNHLLEAFFSSMKDVHVPVSPGGLRRSSARSP